MTTTTASSTRRSTRLHGLDSLRAAALGLGIVGHSLMPFLPGVPWLVTDAQTTEVAFAPGYWIHLFRMVLFMALAGYFGRLIAHRRGTRPYLRDRVIRIGLPAVAFWPVAVLSLQIIAETGAELRGAELLFPAPAAPAGAPGSCSCSPPASCGSSSC